MDESIPLSPRLESQRQIRRNLYRTIDHKLYTSYLLITFSAILSLSKIITGSVILLNTETDSGAPLLL